MLSGTVINNGMCQLEILRYLPFLIAEQSNRLRLVLELRIVN